MTKTFKLRNLDCANCAAKMEKAISEMDGVQNATINFMSQKLTIKSDTKDFESLIDRAEKLCQKFESECTIVREQSTVSDKHKTELIRIILAAIGFVVALVLDFENIYLSLAVALVPYLIVGYDVLWAAFKGIIKGKLFDEQFLMSIATVGAFLLGEFTEGIAVMLFYQIGEWFQALAVGRSRRSIAKLMDIRPDSAVVVRDGQEITQSPENVEIGELIIVRPGEKIPLDGIIESGATSLNMSALTGESAPVDKEVGDTVLSGSLNNNGVITVRVTGLYVDSTVAKILELVEEASSKKAKLERFITRFARYYTPIVVISAALLCIVPVLFFAQPFAFWAQRALIFLVVSCPCALVISVPLSFFGGIGGASRSGILIKGANYMESLAQVKTVVFDKTGTLTEGSFIVSEIFAYESTEQDLLNLAASVERYSRHPIAQSIAAQGKQQDSFALSDVTEIPGKGMSATVNGATVYVGNGKLMEQAGVSCKEPDTMGTVIHISSDGRYLGHIIVIDKIKQNSKAAVQRLKKAGVESVVMLTGDTNKVGKAVADMLEIDEVHAQLLPGQKVEMVEELLKKGQRLAFVGDGVNDAPVLSRADVGIAMGAAGSEAAIEAADIVLMDDDPEKVAKAISISRKTMVIVWQNIIFSLGVKIAVMILGAFGLAGIWLAVFADVGVMFIAILNAMRALSTSKE